MSTGSKLLELSLSQNPAPLNLEGQDFLDKHRACVEGIMAAFFKVLPSNYISQTMGPFYTLQFQALAEQLCRIQITVQEAYEDSDFDFTRPEFLFQFIGALVFPDPERGYPVIEGDISFRAFLREMVILLLRGATKDAVEEGLNLLTDSNIEVLEKSIASRGNPNALWGLDEQFEFEINVETGGGTGFPDKPFVFKDNLRIVLEALKPAHTIFDCRFLFREILGSEIQDDPEWAFQDHHYADTRKNCQGAKSITSVLGETLSDRFLFTDTTRDFSSIEVGATLRVGFVVTAGSTATFTESGTTFEELTKTFEALGVQTGQVLDVYRGAGTGKYAITSVTDDTHLEVSPVFPADGPSEDYTIFSNPNFGDYRVTDVLAFPAGDDSRARAYTTFPTSLSGAATISKGVVVDGSQDFGSAVEGEVLTFTEGPNIGDYRLQTLLGSDGGPVGFAAGPATQVRPSPSMFRVDRRMPEARINQTYSVGVDRMGVKIPKALSTGRSTGTVRVGSLPSPGDTITLGGVPLLASAGVPGGDEFQVGVDALTTASNIAVAVNNPLNSFTGILSATSVGDLVTLTSVLFGAVGNSVALATSVPLVLILSSGSLLGGANGEDASIFFVV